MYRIKGATKLIRVFPLLVTAGLDAAGSGQPYLFLCHKDRKYAVSLLALFMFTPIYIEMKRLTKWDVE